MQGIQLGDGTMKYKHLSWSLKILKLQDVASQSKFST